MFGQDIGFQVVEIKNVPDFYKLSSRFSCDNLALDAFLKMDALTDEEHTTLIFTDQNYSQIIGYVAFQCSGITMLTKGENQWRVTRPSIQISLFALDSQYHHLQYSPEVEHIYLSDMILSKTIKWFSNIATNTIAAKYVSVYALPTAVNFYRRNNFRAFSEFADPVLFDKQAKKVMSDQWYFVDQCVPMYMPIT